MFRQVIKPETKEDLIIHLPEKFIGKNIEVEATELRNLRTSKKEREKKLKEAFDFFDTISVDMSNFKFNREEANERKSIF